MKHRNRQLPRLVLAGAVASAVMWGAARGGRATANAPVAATAAPVGSATQAAPATAEAAAIRKLLEQKFAGATIGSITRSPYGGLYEVQFDDQVVYTDAKVSYVFVGSVYDANSKRNLTEERVRKLNRIAWNSLPLELAMKKVKGNGQRKLAVFADADCPFCARLEKTLADVDNVTVYTFIYPIDQLHPDAARKTKIIWCAPDRQAAWDAWFATQKLPDNAGDCDTPLEQTLALGQKLRVNATPTLVFADGSMIPGAIPGERLEKELDQAEGEAAKLAAGDAAKGAEAAGRGAPKAPAAKPASAR